MSTFRLGTLGPKELKDFLDNCVSRGETHDAVIVLREMHSRRIARKKDYSFLRWTREDVDEALQAFSTVARTVAGNRNTPLTHAGGT